MNPTRDSLHRVATHVLARARFFATGKFGLRATPGGIGTPLFGDELEVLRVTPASLVRERGGAASSMTLDGSTLSALAEFAGTDLSRTFDAGADTPAMGDPNEPLPVDEDVVRVLAEWWHIGWRVLDAVIANARDAMTIQLWPEHFDAGTSVAVGRNADDRCNLGVSPGDTYSDEPYLYVGPWTADRPGDASYWNAPFGAVLPRTQLLRADDPVTAGVDFMREGFTRFG